MDARLGPNASQLVRSAQHDWSLGIHQILYCIQGITEVMAMSILRQKKKGNEQSSCMGLYVGIAGVLLAMLISTGFWASLFVLVVTLTTYQFSLHIFDMAVNGNSSHLPLVRL